MQLLKTNYYWRCFTKFPNTIKFLKKRSRPNIRNTIASCFSILEIKPEVDLLGSSKVDDGRWESDVHRANIVFEKKTGAELDAEDYDAISEGYSTPDIRPAKEHDSGVVVFLSESPDEQWDGLRLIFQEKQSVIDTRRSDDETVALTEKLIE